MTVRCVHREGQICRAGHYAGTPYDDDCERHCPHRTETGPPASAYVPLRVCRALPAPEPDPPEITLANVLSWLRAEASLRILGPVDAATAAARAEACHGCAERRQSRSKPDAIGWCGACGCGSAAKARLSRKVFMVAKCPRGRW